MTPATHALGWVATLLGKWLTPTPRLTVDEFRTALHEGEAEGVLDRDERSILEGIIRLEGLTAGDVMTPRVDLVGVDESDPPAEIAAVARKARFKYLPVYEETQDRIQGFLDVRHFLLSGGVDVQAALLPPMFVPQSTPLDRLMIALQSQKRRAACVVDEFGGTAGIVTQGDVMEEIIEEAGQGEARRVVIERVGHAIWHIGGDTSLEEINAALELGLTAENSTRIGGWVSERLERIPRRGDAIDTPECRVVVRAVRNRRVASVVLEHRAVVDMA
jgi:CBS domain containing-hemolysin-like protein